MKVDPETWINMKNVFTDVGFTCYSNEDGEYCGSVNQTCSSFYPSMSDLSISINGSFYVIPPAGYTMRSNYEIPEFSCMLAILP